MALPSIPAYTFDAEVGLDANRTSWSLDPRRATVLVHDMQEHFVRVFERTPTSQIDGSVRRISGIVASAREAGVPVCYSAQPPRQDSESRGLLTDFWGAGLADPQAATIISELTPASGDTVLTKHRYSAFYRSDLAERTLQAGRDQLVVVGVYAHIGCLTTALVAFMEGIQAFFVADAMADFSAAEHTMAARYVGGRCGQVTRTADVVAALDPQLQASARVPTRGQR